MNQKSLHKHSMPILIMAFGLLLLSGLMMARLETPNSSDKNLTELMSVKLFSFKPSANGLFHVTRYGSDNQANLNAIRQNGSLRMMEDAGRVAQIEAVVNGAKN